MPVGMGRIFAREVLAKREKEATALQHLAALAPEPLESAPGGGIGRIEQLLQDGSLWVVALQEKIVRFAITEMMHQHRA